MGVLVLATAIILSLLCSLATIVNSVYAHPGSGLNKAKSNTCGRGLEEACLQICKFTSC